MNRAATVLLVVALASVGLSRAGLSRAQQPPEAADSAIQEQVKVRLLLVDGVAMDAQGRTVPGLTKDDFQLEVGGKVRSIDTFDVVCPIGAAEDPKNVNWQKDVLPFPIAPGVHRRVILAFDYYFLPIPDRAPILQAAAAMLQTSKTPEEEVMIVALAYGVRVEQRFTSDLRQLVATLDRMEHDVSLWAQEFGVGASGREYLTDLTALMDVAGSYAEAKGVVLFSEVRTFGTTSDNWFNDVTMHAAAARTAIYPSFAGGIDNWRSDTMERLANQSGGRMPMQTVDVTLAYRWAQRDLSCRYTLGTYLSESEGRARQNVRLTLDEQKGQLRYPEMVKLFTDEEKAASRARAAYLDPAPYENPLVRSFAFPMRPASGNAWDTMLALSLPLPVGAAGRDFTLGAIVKRGPTRAGKYESTFHVDAPAGGGETRPVTVFGDAALKPGQHRLTVVLSEPGNRKIVSAETQFTVPDMLEGLLLLRGPAFARVVPGAKVFRAGGKPKEGPTRVEQMLGADAGFEPLFINEIESREALLTYWSGCVVGKSQIAPGAVVRRRFLDDEGEVAHELSQTSLKLESRGDRVQCQEMLEKIEPNTLPVGDYRYEVTVLAPNGEPIARGEAPLNVR